MDPVAFEDVFEVIDGVPTLSFAPVKKVGGASVNAASLEELIVIERSLRCLLYTSPSPRDKRQSRMPSSA